VDKLHELANCVRRDSVQQAWLILKTN
jgi:hypothetical protein